MKETDINLLATDLRSRGRRSELKNILQTIVSEHPDDLNAKVQLAAEHRYSGYILDALDILRPLAADVHFAGRLQCILEICEVYVQIDLYEKAIEILEEAQLSFPENHWPILALAKLERKRDGIDTSLAVIESSIERIEVAGRASLAQFYAANMGKRDYDSNRWLDGWGPKKICSVDGLDKAAIIMMVKDEDDIIFRNLNHHYEIGFRVFMIVDNGSSDQTQELIQKFRTQRIDTFVFYCYDPVVGYYQAAKKKAYRDLLMSSSKMESRSIDWIFFLDADEFLTYTGPVGGESRISSTLANSDLAVLSMIWVNCASDEPLVEVPDDESVFRTFSLVQGRMGEVATKVAISRVANLDPTQGNHFVETYPLGLDQMVPLSSLGWYLFHFPLRSRKHVLRKVINGGLSHQGAVGLENHGGHWKARYDRYLQSGEGEIDKMLREHIQMISDSRA